MTTIGKLLSPATSARRALWALAALAAFLLIPGTASAASPTRLQWQELGLLSGKTARIVTAEGAVLTGKLKGLDAGALVFDVKGTSDAKAHSKGPARIERTDMLRLEVETKRKVFRILGTAVGSFAGLICGGVAAFGISGGVLSDNHSDGLAAAAFVGLWAGGTAGGYFAGNAADQRWTLVEITK